MRPLTHSVTRLDEAIALPTEFSARIARNTQLILQEETGVSNVIDPLAGSYYVESLTAELADAAWDIIKEIDEMGGMTKAVASGMPKLRIEESAAKRQAMLDKGEEVVVGVNKYRLETQDKIDIRNIDDSMVRETQISRLADVKKNRDDERCNNALENLELVAREGGNLLNAAIEAARARATVGEISMAMEKELAIHLVELWTIFLVPTFLKKMWLLQCMVLSKIGTCQMLQISVICFITRER